MVISRSTPVKILPVSLVATTVVLLDLAIKQRMQQWLDAGESMWFYDHSVGLDPMLNRRLAFSLGPEQGIASLFVVAALIVLLFLVASGQFGSGRWAAMAAGLVLGGALANALDRLTDGSVVDYVAVGSFPRFNIADACLTVGIAVILCAELAQARSVSA